MKSNQARIACAAVLAGVLGFALWWTTDEGAAPLLRGTPAAAGSDTPGASPVGVGPEQLIPVGLDRAGDRKAVDAVSAEPTEQAPALSIGLVHDVDARPVSGAKVYFEPSPSTQVGPHLGEPDATTDEAGSFSLSWPTWGRLVAETATLTTVVPAFTTQDPLVVVVAPRRAYSGIVVNEQGQRLAGASIDVRMDRGFARRLRVGEERSTARTWRVDSAQDGSFVLEDVGWTPGLLLESRCDGLRPASLVLPAESRADLEIVLERILADDRSLVGTVVDPQDEPVAGATVGMGRGAAGTSDEHGGFLLQVPEELDGGTLRAAKLGYLPAQMEIEDLAPHLGPSPAEPITLVLGGPPLSIEGKVVDGDGQPVPKARVFTWDLTYMGGGHRVEAIISGEPFSPRAITDDEGRFAVRGVLPRPYVLRAMHPATMEVASVEDVEGGARDVRITMHGLEMTHRVAGRVVTTDGDPVEGVLLLCGRQSAPGIDRLGSPLLIEVPRSDDEGRFEFEAMCVEGAFLVPSGAKIASASRLELDPSMDLEDLKVVVSRKCKFQIVLEGDPEEATFFYVLDAEGVIVPLSYSLGNMTYSGSGWDLVGGRSEVMVGDERARTILLLKGREEIRRVPIQLQPGETRVLRL